MSLLITDTGIAASIRAGELGVSYKIAEISIGTEGYTPTADQTVLRNEVQRKAITRGEVTALGRLHFETVWDGAEAFEGKELGYWLDDGTLFAVDSRDGEVITYKQKDTVVIEACELNLAASSIDNISVELLEAYSATEERAGIAKIATQEQAELATNDQEIMTPLKTQKWWGKVTSLAQSISGNWNFTGVLREKGQRVFSPNYRNISDSLTSNSRIVYASVNGLKKLKDMLTLGFSIRKARNGYICFPDFLGEFIIQWGDGQARSNTAASGYPNALPMAYPNTQFGAIAIHNGSNAVTTNVILTSNTNTHVMFKSEYAGSLRVFYISLGW